MTPASPAPQWRVGDLVVVNPERAVTTLGEGRILDIETLPGTRYPSSALVRFEHGPVKGVWYSVSNLKWIGDLSGLA